MEIIVTIGYKDREIRVVGEIGYRKMEHVYKDATLPITVYSGAQIISEVIQFNRSFIRVYIVDIYCKPKFSLWRWITGKLPEFRDIKDVLSDDDVQNINNWNIKMGKKQPTYSGFKTTY